MCKYLFNLSLGICVVLISPRTVVAKEATWKWPVGLQVGMDIFQPLKYAYRKTGNQYELNGNFDLGKVGLVMDYGWGRIKHEAALGGTGRQSIYTSQGTYFRVGLDYNFLAYTSENNTAFLGLRYAKGYLNDYLRSYIISDSNDGRFMAFWNGNGNRLFAAQQQEVITRWWELVAGVKGHLWGWIYGGLTVRYKFALKVYNNPMHLPFELLGWGFYDKNAFGISYYLAIRIPLVQKDMNTIAKPRS